MIERVIDISESPARLSVRLDQLVVEMEQGSVSAPIDELAAVVVSHPAVTFTHPALAALAEAGVAVIVCDEKHSPVGMLMPLSGHHLQAERFDLQAHADLPLRKRLWKQIVHAKIGNQGKLLQLLTGADSGLGEMAKTVHSGDPENIEAQAARRYWSALFGPGFVRQDEKHEQNAHLNYGYAVLRATVTRAICAAGLHPSLGLHHHNQYDAFCLASDLTEPFRPLVDRKVQEWFAQHQPPCPVDRLAKAHLLTLAMERYDDPEGERRSLFDLLAHVTASLAAVFEGRRKELALPEII